MFDIDWQGTATSSSVCTGYGAYFVLPPSVEQLETRLRDRKTDNEEVIKYRMSNVTNEISHWAEYEYVVINEKLEDTINAIHAIIRSERLKRRRQVDNIADFVQKLRMDSENMSSEVKKNFLVEKYLDSLFMFLNLFVVFITVLIVWHSRDFTRYFSIKKQIDAKALLFYFHKIYELLATSW